MNVKLLRASEVEVGMYIEGVVPGWWPVTGTRTVAQYTRGNLEISWKAGLGVYVQQYSPEAHVLVGIKDSE